MEKDRVLEIFLAVILVIFLIVLIFLFTNSSVTGKSTSTLTITNSYNTNYYNTYEQIKDTQTYKNDYIVYERDYEDNKKDYTVYNKRSSITDETKHCEYIIDKDPFDYSDKGHHETKDGMFGEQVDTFEVYVRNREYEGGYFKVIFYLENYYGEEFTTSVRHYIKAREEKTFFYRDIHDDKYKYDKWDYDVISESKIQDREYICYWD